MSSHLASRAIRAVASTSHALGVASPEGWLWASTIARLPNAKARPNSARGLSVRQSAEPEWNDSSDSSRWSWSRNRTTSCSSRRPEKRAMRYSSSAGSAQSTEPRLTDSRIPACTKSRPAASIAASAASPPRIRAIAVAGAAATPEMLPNSDNRPSAERVAFDPIAGARSPARRDSCRCASPVAGAVRCR